MLDALFLPKAVAIIGASTKELSIGNVILRNLQEYGYRGEIFPIHPTAPEVRGIKAFRSMDEIPGEVDLAHVILPAGLVPRAIEDCGKKGVKAVVINSAGFNEMGKDGAALQAEFLATAKKYGVRVFGPNCQGIINTDPAVKAYCNFTFTHPKPGAVSVVASSGGVGELIMQELYGLGIGMRMYASNGNACDISIPEILRYFGDDAGCKAIVLFTEGIPDPKGFLDVAREVAARKPVLAMKAGRTAQGARAASSHTGSLASVDLATERIFEKAGILSFGDEEEMSRAAMAFATQAIPAGNRVGIITNTGGPAVIATDVFVAAGLDVPRLSDASIVRLRSTQLPLASLENPIDVVATAGGPQFRAAMDVLQEDDGVDCIFLNFVTAAFTDTDAVAREIAAVNRLGKKPIVCNFMTDLRQDRYRTTTRILNEGGVPIYANPTAAAKALCALAKYGTLRRRDIGSPEFLPGVNSDRATAIVDRARQRGCTFLPAADVYPLFEAYGIPVADWKVVDTAGSAVTASDAIGYPVVIKADSETIDHKSDVGGVAVNLGDAAAVRAAVTRLQDRFRASGTVRFLVQKYLPGGSELIVGGCVSEGLGHLVTFGLGGIHVEAWKDVVFKIAPVTRVEAREMLSSIKAKALFDGTRGENGVDTEKVVDLILRTSQLLTDVPSIREIDINPILAFRDAVYAVDGRIRI
jgi:acyl-CoA synthetase (NDP forming)